MIAEHVHHEFINWARWCWSGAWPHPIPPDHAASLEGRYLAPSDLGEPPEPRPIPPNRQRAEIVHSVFMDRLTQNERWALIHRYIRRTEDRIACRRMRVSMDVFETALVNAANKVGGAFREGVAAV